MANWGWIHGGLPAPAITESFPRKTSAAPTVSTATTRRALAIIVLTASPAELQ